MRIRKSVRSFAIVMTAASAAGMAYAQTPPNAGSILRDESPTLTQPPKESVTLPRLQDPISEPTDGQPIAPGASM